jgi:hypothetical protein
MSDFVHRENLARYKRLLEQTTDLADRERLKQLLAEEERSSDSHRPDGKITKPVAPVAR